MADEDGLGSDIRDRSGVEILDSLPEEERAEVIETVTREYHTFRSPLLPPEVMRQYGEVIPGLEEKLVQWTEDETSHRRGMELAAFDEARQLRMRAQIAGPLLAVLSVVVASSIALYNPSWAGAAIATVIVIAGVGGPFAARQLASRWNSQSDDTTSD